MKFLLRPTCLLLILIWHLNSGFAQTRHYIKEHKELAVELSERYHIPVSVILVVAILESGAGKSKAAKVLNNHFGVVGKNNLVKNRHQYKSKYKGYDDVRSSYEDFCRIVSHKIFYVKLKNNTDYKPWVDKISKAGYCELAGFWNTKVKSIIRKRKLYMLDKA
jgi:flagellum-specific peptidoglycan hydrolase FlgJ